MSEETDHIKFERHRDALIHLFAKTVTDWAEENETGETGAVAILFVLAIQWAYMAGAVITAKANGDSEEQFIEFAQIVWKETHGRTWKEMKRGNATTPKRRRRCP